MNKNLIIKKMTGVLSSIILYTCVASILFVTGCTTKEEVETSYPYDDLIEATVVGYDDSFLTNKLWTKSTASIINNTYSIDNALTLEFTFKRDAVIESISFDYSTILNSTISFIVTPDKINMTIFDYAVKGNGDGYRINVGQVSNITIPLNRPVSEYDTAKYPSYNTGRDISDFKAGDKFRITIASKNEGYDFSMWPSTFANYGVKIFNIKWNKVI